VDIIPWERLASFFSEHLGGVHAPDASAEARSTAQ
jgi:hypothetical protein